MKKFLLLVVLAFLISCHITKKANDKNSFAHGIFKRQDSSEKLELLSDGTYTLYNPEASATPVFEQCEIESKGKWSVLSSDVLELISEDNYLIQKGFEYNLKKENRLSQDSLYIRVHFPEGYEPSVRLNFMFNDNVSKSVETDKLFIAIPKSKHLWAKRPNLNTPNLIRFSVNANISGTTLYRGRILFDIFNEYIDTEKNNFLTIFLLNFDRCFFEFEPLNKELIYIKSNSQLLWDGDIWKREKD